MNQITKMPPGKLVEAAAALEEELERMGAIAREAQQLPLDSQRNLQLTQERLLELAAEEPKLQPLVNGLMAAVTELVQEQRAQAAAVVARTEELSRRREVFQQLMVRYAGLGRATEGLSTLVQKFAIDIQQNAGEAASTHASSLEAVQETMTQLIDTAKEVFQAARQDNFEDIAQQTDSLRQQILSARDKLNLLGARHH